MKKTASDLDVSCARRENVFASLEDEVEILRLAHEMLGSQVRHRQRLHADQLMPWLGMVIGLSNALVFLGYRCRGITSAGYGL